MQEMMMKTSLMALATLMVAGTASATTTQNPFAQDSATVRLKDLDLSTPDGQQRLAIRMDQAARAVCGENMAGIHLALEEQARACRSAVLADMRVRIEARTADAAPHAPVKLASSR
jgi:UrcA family protein